MSHLIAPSILAADFGNLERDIRMLNDSEADWIHCDIMDGTFVPNISFGFPILSAVKKVATKPLDVHLMVEAPERYLQAFKDAGADIITVHQEASVHLDRTLTAIRDMGIKGGVVLNPSTPVDTLKNVMHLCDVVLLMSVNPGYGGQKFIPNTYEKVKRLVELRAACGTDTLIEIDGGVKDHNAPELLKAGADVLVAGSFVFKSEDPIQTIADLKAI